jgi:hypothetical protein
VGVVQIYLPLFLIITVVVSERLEFPAFLLGQILDPGVPESGEYRPVVPQVPEPVGASETDPEDRQPATERDVVDAYRRERLPEEEERNDVEPSSVAESIPFPLGISAPIDDEPPGQRNRHGGEGTEEEKRRSRLTRGENRREQEGRGGPEPDSL